MQRWTDYLSNQVEFHLRTGNTSRRDSDFNWSTYETTIPRRFPRAKRQILTHLSRLGLVNSPGFTLDWLQENRQALWTTRSLFQDQVSRMLFDSALILKMTSHRSFLFPRIDFDPLVESLSCTPFVHLDLPDTYGDEKLCNFRLKIACRTPATVFNLATPQAQIELLNNFRQYFIVRDAVSFLPEPGDVILDCGSCIGDTAITLGAFASPGGQVHAFDLSSLHARFCRWQAEQNRHLEVDFLVNELGVSDKNHDVLHASTSTSISPNLVLDDTMPSTRIDDYAAKIGRKINLIKMDIEGAERDALAGAASVIKEHRPNLAISVYHRPDDLWVIPDLIRNFNPDYRFYFGHHTPVSWESVLYAV